MIYDKHLDEGVEFTWRHLKEALDLLTPEQLRQTVQIMPHNSDQTKPTRLQPVVVMGTVEALCHTEGEVCQETISAVKFAHVPEQVVIVTDYNPFGKYGDTSYTLNEDLTLTVDVSGITFACDEDDY